MQFLSAAGGRAIKHIHVGRGFVHIWTIFGHNRTKYGHIRTIFGPWAGPGPGRARAQAKHDLLAYDINKKDVQRPYDPFAGGIAPRSLLCVRKRRLLFLTVCPPAT